MIKATGWAVVSLTANNDAHPWNQDRTGMDGTLFCVADGMGGPGGGDIAATIAIRSVMETRPDTPIALERAFQTANTNVRSTASRRPYERHMGTTLTVVAVTPTELLIASVGDTRCYLVGAQNCERLTVDDTLATIIGIPSDDERYAHASSKLTAHIGADSVSHVEVRSHHITTLGPHTVVLTSDGLHDYIDERDLRYGWEYPLDQYTLNVAAKAQMNGSPDDITVVAVAIQTDTTREHG